MKLMFWIVALVVAAVFGSFAASNRQSIALGLWPLPVVTELPLYIALLGALLIGAVLGVFGTWIAGRHRRREARRRARRLATLERELAAAQALLPTAAERRRPLAARG
jgi:lipopolysaccharide assembly protein A